VITRRFNKAELVARTVNGKKTVVSFHLGDHGQYATDNTTGEWWFAVCHRDAGGSIGTPSPDAGYFGPYPKRRDVERAWKREHIKLYGDRANS
jgi:hypothetical protein